MLEILKLNLQQLTSANDNFLKVLLEQADQLIKKEGIIDDSSVAYKTAVIDYAAFLFRKRANEEMIMPRFLRYELNNILFSQKSK